MADHDHYLQIIERLASIDARLAALEARLDRDRFEQAMDDVAEETAQDVIDSGGAPADRTS